MVKVDFKLARRGFRHRAIGGDQLQFGQLVDVVEHVGEVVKVIDRVDLALGVAIVGARRTRRLQVAFGIAFAVQ